MYFENNRTLSVVPGWTAEFIFRYQVSMSGDGWGLVLHGPELKTIDLFKDFLAYCGKDPAEWSDGELMSLLTVSKDGRCLKIHGTYDGDSDWTLDLRTGRWVKIKVDRVDPWAEEEDAAGDGTMAMTRSQMLFNLIGLVVAGHCVLFIGIAWYVFTRDPSPASEGAWHFVRGYGALLIVMIGGGAVANFARGRLSRWPTRFMIAGYCLSILLLPLAFWGLGTLWRERRRQEEQRSSADP
jgi:hypothetical protein